MKHVQSRLEAVSFRAKRIANRSDGRAFANPLWRFHLFDEFVASGFLLLQRLLRVKSQPPDSAY